MGTRTPVITLLITLVTAGSATAQTHASVATLSPVSQALLVTAPAHVPAGVQSPQRRDSRWNGFLIGVVAGAIPGVLVGMGIKTYCENEARNCDGAVPIGGVLGGAVGGFIGAAVDDAIGNSATNFRPRPAPGVRFSVRF